VRNKNVEGGFSRHSVGLYGPYTDIPTVPYLAKTASLRLTARISKLLERFAWILTSSTPFPPECTWRPTVGGGPVVIDTDCARWSATWIYSPGWGWRTMGYSSNSCKPRLRISWTGARGHESLLWLLSPTVLSIEPMGNDWRCSVSWSSLLASSRVLPSSLSVEFP